MDNSQIQTNVNSMIKETQKSNFQPLQKGNFESFSESSAVQKGKVTVTVLGAGHGGLATAGHIALKGFPVKIYSPFEKELAPIRERGGIKLEGDVQGFAKLSEDAISLLTSSLDEAIRDADLVLLIMPALAHRTIASLIGPFLQEGQVVILSPGRTGGALEFQNQLKRFAITTKIILAEAQTFLYAVESRGPAHVEVMKVKNKVLVAALPAKDTPAALAVANKVYPEYTPAKNVLETSLNNVGAVVHPAPMLLNTGLIDLAAQGKDLRYYRDIITPTMCNLVMERVDAEKVSLVEAFGLNPIPAKQWYKECYGIEGNSLYEVLQNNHYYVGFSAPKHFLGYHHVLDEVPNSLVPMSEFGRLLGVQTPMIDAIIELANAMCAVDFRLEGRTLDKLGLYGLDRDAILNFVQNGY
ncbi:MAG: opine dehydrogenase [Clostridia bacterium]|nr:opine dehydrogenase [Clostridia bacterium]